jgi:membrane-associated phospholipid phosphatase
MIRAIASSAHLRKAAIASAGLSLLFVIVYGSTSYITSLRHHVGSFYFWWERYIPFVPLFIIPYMSIDLFFVGAPFICRDDVERRVLARRIAASILIAGACFLAFPLNFEWQRPQVVGWLGAIFHFLYGFDRQYNQCPSLHMALRTILALAYVRRFGGALGWMLRVWFSLIGLSTLLTYQHHVIDILGGYALGTLCVYMFRDRPLRLPVQVNVRVGFYYLAGFVGLAAMAVAIGGWAWLAVWPVISLLLVSLAYFHLGPGIFRKSDGKLAFSAKLMLWPVLLGQRLSLMHYTRQCDPWHPLLPRLWIGRKLTDAEARSAVEQGVVAVVDLTGEMSEAAPFLALAYLHLRIMDLTAPLPEQIEQAIDFIRAHSERGIVYVHCKAGYSRTAVIAGAYLLAIGQAADADQAVAALRAARSVMVIRAEALDAIRCYERRQLQPAKLGAR